MAMAMARWRWRWQIIMATRQHSRTTLQHRYEPFSLPTFTILLLSLLIVPPSWATKLPIAATLPQQQQQQQQQQQPPPLASTTTSPNRRLGNFKDGAPSSEIDCSLSPDRDYEYYIERCYDTITQWWINGHCRNGVKEEASELHHCRGSNGGRPYCHDCPQPGSGTGSTGHVKHVCGSDSSDRELVCGIAWAGAAEDCGAERLKAYSHQCDAGQSWYLRESFRCEESKVYATGPKMFTCGLGWYYAFEKDEHVSGEEHPYSSEGNRYCLDCGMGIQVCASGEDATCASLGLPLPGESGGTVAKATNTADPAAAAVVETSKSSVSGKSQELNDEVQDFHEEVGDEKDVKAQEAIDELSNLTNSSHMSSSREKQEHTSAGEAAMDDAVRYPDSHRSAWETHGIVGAVTFGLVVPTAILVSSWNPTQRYHKWVRCIHGCINVLIFTMAMLTVGTAFHTMHSMGELGEGHVKELHHIVGLLLLLSAGFLLTANGILWRTSTPPEQELMNNCNTELRHGTNTAPKGTRGRSTAKGSVAASNETSTTALVAWLLLFGMGSYQVQSGLGLFAKRYGTPDWGIVYIGYTVWLAVMMLVGTLRKKWRERKMKHLTNDNDYAGVQLGPSSSGCGDNDSMGEHYESPETALKW